MEIIFADAFYFIAMLNDADESHHEVMKTSNALRAIVLTTDYILLEVADALAGTRKRKEVKGFIHFIRSASWMKIVSADREWFEAGLDLYSARKDKAWSLTDCISFVVMRDRGIIKALTSDHHFVQAGFQVMF